MSTELEELVVKLAADTQQLQAEMRASAKVSQQNTHKIAKAVENLKNDTKKDVGSMQRIWETMAGFVGGQAIGQAIGFAKDRFMDLYNVVGPQSVAAAQTQQDSINKLNQALARNGQYSAETSAEIQAFASELQKTSTVGDEASLELTALALNFTNSTEQAKAMTAAAIDLSAATGLSLDGAIKNLGKTMAGLTGELGESVPSLRNLTAEQLKSGAAIELIANKFRGAAQGDLKSFSGGIDSITNLFGDFQEQIGFAVIENQAVVQVLGAVNEVLQEMIQWMTENQQTIREWVANGVMFAVESLKVMVDTLGAVAEFFGGSDTLAAASNALEKVGDAAADGMAEVLMGSKATIPVINQQVSIFQQMSSEMQTLANNGKELANTLIDSSKGVENQYSLELETLQLKNEAALVSDEEYFLTRQEMLLEKYATEQEMLDTALQAQILSREEHAIAVGELANKTANEQLRIQMEQVKKEQELNAKKEQNFKDSMSTVASLASSGNKTLANIGKAAAVYNATVDGYAAVQKALASAPPPLNFVLAAAVGAASASNISKIVSTSPAGLNTGIDSVPGIGNSDNFPAMLTPGERVVPKETNKDLTQALKNGMGGPVYQISTTIQIQGDYIADQDTAIRLGEKLNDAVRRGLIRLETS